MHGLGAIVQTPQHKPKKLNSAALSHLLSQAVEFLVKFKLPDSWKRLIFLGILILIAHGVWKVFCGTGEDIAGKLFHSSEHAVANNNLKDDEKKLASAIQSINPKTVPLAAKHRLKEQTLKVKSRAVNQFKLTTYFYKQFFIAVSMSTMGAVVSVVTLFSISKTGWDNCKSKPLVDIFIVSAGVTVLFSSSIFVFQLEKNITENKTLYLAYAALEDRILTYLATQQFRLSQLANSEVGSSSSTKKEIKRFENRPLEVISLIDGELAAINNIAIGFDATKIPNYQDLQKLTNEVSSNDR
uniref:Uncharacterized protein n=1 Tax=Oscillatoriales cyanobacterium SpSt-402 TaxID=2282168 RepID=A0A832M2N7_9CYAN